MAIDERTYYEILEISPEATELDIKKAYRRLALKHHPDRNNGSPESTERFKEIGQAYECLSHSISKHDYDADLKRQQQATFSQGTTASSGSASPYPTSPAQYYRSSAHAYPTGRSAHPFNPNFDAFAQFDRNFRHDPFFQEAFRDMDEEFARRFRATNSDNNGSNTLSEQQRQGARRGQSKEGWIPWLLRRCGIEFQMTSYTSNGGGGMTATHSSSTDKSSYTQKQNQVYTDRHGRQVRVQSMEQNGNLLEDTYVDGKLVQRKVNGVVEPIQRLES